MKRVKSAKQLPVAAFCVLLPVWAGLASPAQAGAFQQCGKASWYKLGGQTASGETANPKGLTAAHRTLPFGTLVKVTNLANGKTVTVRINDRGPFAKGRVIDVTWAAAKELGFVRKGLTRVKVTGPNAKPGQKHKYICQ
ncbi:septal ring lytic transglycosylase RlpA family protein [Roseibium sediminicola]|uniref:Endolytic peptidoglycan transglycosylase RlpA n=1 Tax=Roseibium sediminicola TaxID=2933272 RepID=A0ABT0GV33_9HYPH|nr:septal ring lytic transglycosylase RlpA family protein [Roseibium sp. CAU 1639]MCK7613292.1 septal ring lytic transglycosylase RlpA family protein [Roseibium sp. CAU 1639]